VGGGGREVRHDGEPAHEQGHHPRPPRGPQSPHTPQNNPCTRDARARERAEGGQKQRRRESLVSPLLPAALLTEAPPVLHRSTRPMARARICTAGGRVKRRHAEIVRSGWPLSSAARRRTPVP
jgi:hypothetical protein